MAERAFAKAWAEENTDNRHLLDFLLREDSTSRLTALRPEPRSAREYQIAATLIQWLGSNIGLSFLAEVLSSIPHDQRHNHFDERYQYAKDERKEARAIKRASKKKARNR